MVHGNQGVTVAGQSVFLSSPQVLRYLTTSCPNGRNHATLAMPSAQAGGSLMNACLLFLVLLAYISDCFQGHL